MKDYGHFRSWTNVFCILMAPWDWVPGSKMWRLELGVLPTGSGIWTLGLLVVVLFGEVMESHGRGSTSLGTSFESLRLCPTSSLLSASCLLLEMWSLSFRPLLPASMLFLPLCPQTLWNQTSPFFCKFPLSWYFIRVAETKPKKVQETYVTGGFSPTCQFLNSHSKA